MYDPTAKDRFTNEEKRALDRLYLDINNDLRHAPEAYCPNYCVNTTSVGLSQR